MTVDEFFPLRELGIDWPVPEAERTDLPESLTLDFHGFKLELEEIGFSRAL